jgi:glycerate 2-kinase
VVAELVLLEGGRTAALDAAQAVGLSRLGSSELDPWQASTHGVGELIAAAAAAGAEEVIVAPGGTATVDGGAGAIAALRDLRHVPRLRVACDVRTAWEDAAATFGPQKGASSDLVAALAGRLDDLAGRLPRDPRGRALTGCGGGLSGGLWARFEAELLGGADYVLDTIRCDELVAGATLVVTGEGRIDEQTSEGKLVAAVARRCSRLGVPCVAVVGQDALGRAGAERLGLARVVEAPTLDDLRAVGRQLGSSR